MWFGIVCCVGIWIVELDVIKFWMFFEYNEVVDICDFYVGCYFEVVEVGI